MAKGLPYFKFTPTEWLTGDICFESFEVQGLFINICALYWQRDGQITLEDIERRYKKPTALDSLLGRFLSVNEGFITISFLDEQFAERNHISKQNSENGSKGGRPKALKTQEEKPIAKPPLSEIKAKKSQEELELEKEERIRIIRKEFGNSLRPYLQKYEESMIREFFNYWAEPNQQKTKIKYQMQKTWDLSGRLATWKNRSKNFNNKSTIENPYDTTIKQLTGTN